MTKQEIIEMNTLTKEEKEIRAHATLTNEQYKQIKNSECVEKILSSTNEIDYTHKEHKCKVYFKDKDTLDIYTE